MIHKIKCDCCGTETLCVIHDGKLVIKDRRHGKSHIAVLTCQDIIKAIKEGAREGNTGEYLGFSQEG